MCVALNESVIKIAQTQSKNRMVTCYIVSVSLLVMNGEWPVVIRKSTDLFCYLICFEAAEPLEQQINVSSAPEAERWYLPLEIGNCGFL